MIDRDGKTPVRSGPDRPATVLLQRLRMREAETTDSVRVYPGWQGINMGLEGYREIAGCSEVQKVAVEEMFGVGGADDVQPGQS